MDYKAGDIVEQRTALGVRQVLVHRKSKNIKNGLPGFDGVEVGTGMDVWGYNDQIVAVIPEESAPGFDSEYE